jgi:hypothetical protein
MGFPVAIPKGEAPLARKKDRNKSEVIGFLGVGLDNQDGHQRVTRSEHFLLLGGSGETHERMQDVVVKFGESLRRRGKTLPETEPDEAVDLLRDALDS